MIQPLVFFGYYQGRSRCGIREKAVQAAILRVSSWDMIQKKWNMSEV